ncbi:MAG: hypothetical protein IPK97_12780 [Ahniella sp.]|nr:hypothetical protein [Ahniella sp.]
MLAAAILFLVVPTGLMLWLLLSGSARDWSLARVVSSLPADALSIGAAEGRLIGPLVLHDLHYRGDGFSLNVDRLEMDHALLPVLVGGRLRISQLHIDRLRIELDPVDDSLAAAPARVQLPTHLPWPTLELPIDVALAELKVARLDVLREGRELLPASALIVRDAELTRQTLRLGALDLDSERGRLTLAGSWACPANPRPDLTRAGLSLERRHRPRHSGSMAKRAPSC